MSFSDINLPSDFFDSEVFLDYLKKEFAVFLFLNQAQNKEILINGEKLDYEDVIEDSDNKVILIESDCTNFYFNVTYIRWKEKMKENYCMYFWTLLRRRNTKKLQPLIIRIQNFIIVFISHPIILIIL